MSMEIFNYKSPDIPTTIPFPGGLLPHDILKISMDVKKNFQIFVSFKASDDEKIDSRIPLHLDINENRMVVKCGKDKEWKLEQRVDMVENGEKYVLTVSSNETQYLLQIDEKPICTFAHKYPSSCVELLELKIVGDGKECIESVSFYKKCLWIGKHTQGNFPENVLCCGTDQNKSEIYVGRTYKNNSLLAIRVIPDRNEAFVAYNGKEYPVYDYELLQNSQFYDWKDVKDDQIPNNSITVGFDERAEPLFIGRTEVDGVMLPGNIRKSNCSFATSYNGKELKMSTKFQVLVTLSPTELQEKLKSTTADQIQQEQEKPNSTHERKCVVCWDKDPNSVFDPCGHVAVCYGCAVNCLNSDKRCPICRSKITNTIKMFYSV